jgi:hypothetical protein
MKIKILIFLLVIMATLQGEKAMLILPYCTKNISDREANHLLVATRRIVFASDAYSQTLSFATEKLIFEKTAFNQCDYFLRQTGAEKFEQVVAATAVNEILSSAVNFDKGEYGIFFKLKDAKTGEILKSKAYGSTTDFSDLIARDLRKILNDFLNIRDNRNRFVGISFSGGYLNHYEDYCAGFRLSFGSRNYGELALETNLYTDQLAENIALSYITPMKYFFYLKLGLAFTSEQKTGFSLTEYYDAPHIDEIEKMEHSAGAIAAVGLSLPLSDNFRINLSAESDIIFAKWKYWNGQKDEGFIYCYYPELEISYLIRFK